MFKKTLLALAVAGASLSANAGILTVDVKETAAVANELAGTTGVDYKTAPVAVGALTSCTDAASSVGATVDLDGKTNNATADAVTLSDAGTAGVYTTTANTVKFTADDACTVTINKDQLVAADDAKYSQEGAAANGLTLTADLIAGVGGVKAEDTIAITVSGGTIDEDASASAQLNGGTNISILGVSGNTIRFTVDTGTGPTLFGPRAIIPLTGLVVKPTEGSDSISLSSFVTNTAGVEYDTSSSAEITKIAKQYTAKVDFKADGIIDVATERYDFELRDTDAGDTALTTDDAKTTDTFGVEIVTQTTNGNLTPTSADIVVKGNFSWVKDYAGTDGELSATELEQAFTYVAYGSKDTDGLYVTDANSDTYTSGKATLNEQMDELTVPVTVDTGVDKYHTITFNVPGTAGSAETSLQTTDFTASVDFEDASENALNAVTDAAVGEWTLNGSVVEVPYIPFGPNTQPIIRHTNTGSQTGDISVRYMVEEGNGLVQSNKWQSLGVVVEDAKPGVRNLLNIVTEKLEAALNTNKFKVALEITTNVPGEDVTVFAAAKVTAEGQDRLTIGAFQSKSSD